MKQSLKYAALLFVVIFTSHCFASDPSLKDVTVIEAKASQLDSSILWLDIRESSEFQSLPKLPFAKHVPLSQFEKSFTSLGIQKDQTFYIICRSGNRSKRLQRHLVSQGYTDAINILGGMKAWRAKIK
ncbi:MAG: rhodanese-like domain-containing protein [Fibrobacterales bacterium]